MGIPSYFKTLTEKIPGCLRPKPGDGAVKYLLFDFNCIVYNCLKTMRSYKGDQRIAWEGELCLDVEKALVTIWESAGRPPHVFIGVDGVVPMAKIKQQRMRRFKSVWWSEQEVAHGVRSRDVETWDKNAITPGTAFMERLGECLTTFSGKRGWTVSTSAEPGEGEHKVMEWLRTKVCEPGSVLIYGLDADLIVLSMLTATTQNPCFLMREKSEFGQIQKRFENSTFLFLSVEKLLESICWQISDKRDFIVNYVAVMSTLGNDFLPHGLTLKIREGGHEKMLDILRKVYGDGGRFVDGTGQIIWSTFQKLFEDLAKDEDKVFETAAKKKRGVRHPAARSESDAKMIPVQILPIDWFAEKEFLRGDRLLSGWEKVYERHVPREDAIREWKYGAQWILDYYLGKPINTFWFYPWHLPPLWKWLAEDSAGAGTTVFLQEEPLQPIEQLAIVLPMESWWLVRDKALQSAPTLYPQMWPSRFGFASLGKWWMWECEADIPILLPRQLRALGEA